MRKFVECFSQQTPFAFGGGIIKSIKQSRFEKAFKPYENDISCVTFSKLKNSSYDFFASSVIVWENAIDEEDIDSIFDHVSNSESKTNFNPEILIVHPDFFLKSYSWKLEFIFDTQMKRFVNRILGSNVCYVLKSSD